MKRLTKVVIGLSGVALLVVTSVVAVVVVAPSKVEECIKTETMEAFRTGDTKLSRTTLFWIRASKLNQIITR